MATARPALEILPWVLLLALPLVYVGSYFALVYQLVGTGNFGYTTWHEDYYLLGGYGRILYRPIHDLDRHRLRPDYWTEHDEREPWEQ